MTRHICLHGAESTGKTTLASRLAARLGAAVVPEYGRSWCEANGTDLDAGDLLAIFEGHVAATKAAMAQAPAWLVSDTDPLMTQAWAVMLLGERLAEIDAWEDVADLYLVPALDLPWRDDGTRLFGSDLARRQFMDLAIGEL
ncbi:MAG TPA: ATP-binding protein, partial [Sphingopyxis sp.]|nr:ATP-binding protein [Sphingopyxis sp.]